jgi:hypothetical protein
MTLGHSNDIHRSKFRSKVTGWLRISYLASCEQGILSIYPFNRRKYKDVLVGDRNSIDDFLECSATGFRNSIFIL